MATANDSQRSVETRVEERLSNIRAIADALFVLEDTNEAQELQSCSKQTLMELINIEAETAQKIMFEDANNKFA